MEKTEIKIKTEKSKKIQNPEGEGASAKPRI